MHRNIIFTFGIIVYCLVATVGLYLFDAGLFVSVLALLGAPIYFLSRFSAAPSAMLVTAACFAAGLSLLLEGVAFYAGLWEFKSVTGLVALGWLSVDMVFVGIMKVLFLILFYELLFDDGNYTLSRARQNMAEFGLFALASLAIVVLNFWWFGTLDVPTAYYWITIFLIGASVAMLTLRRALTLRLVDKISLFVLVAMVPMLCLEFLLIADGFKTLLVPLHAVAVPLSGIEIPLAEVLLALSVPVFVTTIYELYLDDGM